MKNLVSTFISANLRPNKLSSDEEAILIALLQGSTLKSHRNLDGEKIYQLHALTGKSQSASKHSISRLQKHDYIASNQKFPAATYILTQKGKDYASQLVEVDSYPIIALLGPQ